MQGTYTIPSDKMPSPPEKQIIVLSKPKDNLDAKFQKLEKDIKKSLRVSCREQFNEYLNSSTLHGPRL